MDVLVDALIVGVVFIVPVWVIFRKAGFRPALSLLLFVPFIGFLVVSLVLSFAKWPAARGDH